MKVTLGLGPSEGCEEKVHSGLSPELTEDRLLVSLHAVCVQIDYLNLPHHASVHACMRFYESLGIPVL